MFLELGVKPQNKFWKYLVGSLIFLLGFTIGQIMISLVVMLLESVNHTSKLPAIGSASLGYLPPNVTLFLLAIAYVISLATLYFIFRYLHRQNWTSVTTSRPKTDWNRTVFAFAVSAIYWILCYSVLVYFWPDEQTFQFRPIPFLIFFCILIVLTFLRAMTEQTFYYGYMMQGFANLCGNRWFPLLMVSIVSSVIYATHPEISAMGFVEMALFQFIYSLFFSVLVLMDEGIELAIGFEAATLLIMESFFTSEATALKTDALFTTFYDESETSDYGIGLENYVIRITIIVLFLLICAQKYRWTNWKEKLTGKINVSFEQQIEDTDLAEN